MADNFVFGEKLGNKFQTTGQRFLLEAMMFSLIFIILGSLAGTIYTVFFTKLSIIPKIIAGTSGTFGAVFMLAILIMTYQSYKSYLEILDIQTTLKTLGTIPEQKTEELKGGKDDENS